jgi:hypothetical protein
MSAMRRISSIVVVLAACNPDEGRPTVHVVVQDSGSDAEAGALAKTGAACMRNEECASAICFVGNQASYCMIRCSAENAVRHGSVHRSV